MWYWKEINGPSYSGAHLTSPCSPLYKTVWECSEWKSKLLPLVVARAGSVRGHGEVTQVRICVVGFFVKCRTEDQFTVSKNIGEVLRFLTSFLYHFTLLCGASGCCVSLGCICSSRWRGLGRGSQAPACGWQSHFIIKLFPAQFWPVPAGWLDHPLSLRARKLPVLCIHVGIVTVAGSLA